MILSFRRPSLSRHSSSSNCSELSDARQLLQRVVDKLQVLVLENPLAAMVVLMVIDEFFDD